MKNAQNAIVTGAGSGIGKAVARILAENDYNLIITGRRKERLEKLSSEIRKNFNTRVATLVFDVRDREAVKQNVAAIPGELKPVDLLVNNAGLALGLSHIQEGDIDLWEQMIDTNIKGLLYMTRAIAPQMAERGSGHIINIGSLAGKETYENGNVYCATKHAVDSLNKGMRLDLLQDGIRVTNVNPGLTQTEFSVVRFGGDQNKANKVYQGYQPLTPEDVAEAVWFAASRPTHVNINDILITPTAQGNSTTVKKT